MTRSLRELLADLLVAPACRVCGGRFRGRAARAAHADRCHR